MVGARSSDCQGDIRTLFGLGVFGNLTEAELIERFIAGRGDAAQSAFAALVERHGPMVWRVCRALLRDIHDAEDAYQATFLVLSRRAAAIRRPELLGNWLYGVAHRTAGKLRASAGRRPHNQGAVEHVGDLVCTDVQDGPEECAIRAEIVRVVHEELARIVERDRAALVLCDLQGLTLEQAALRSGCTVGALRIRLARSRGLLRSRLARRGLAPSAGVLAALLSPRVSVSAPVAPIGRTVQAAIRFAAGDAASRGILDRSAATAEGVLQSMRWAYRKAVAALVLGACTVTGGIGTIAAGYSLATRADDPPPAEQRRATARVAAAASETPFEPAPGCDWNRPPRDAVSGSWASGGVNGIAESRPDGSLVITLSYLVDPDEVQPAFRPVVFDKQRRRFVPELLSGGTSRGNSGPAVALYQYRLAPGVLPADADAYYGIEHVTARGRRLAAEDAVRRARADGVEILPPQKLGEALEFSLTSLDGKKLRSEDFRGRVVLIDCWATWCSPCMAKMPFLKAFYEEHHRDGFEVIGVSFDQDLETAKKSLKVLDLRWPQVYVPNDGKTRELWQEGSGVRELPRLLLIDRRGILHAISTPNDVERVALKLLGLPGEAADRPKP